MAAFKQYETSKGTFWMFKTYIGRDPQTGRERSTTRRGFATRKVA